MREKKPMPESYCICRFELLKLTHLCMERIFLEFSTAYRPHFMMSIYIYILLLNNKKFCLFLFFFYVSVKKNIHFIIICRRQSTARASSLKPWSCDQAQPVLLMPKMRFLLVLLSFLLKAELYRHLKPLDFQSQNSAVQSYLWVILVINYGVLQRVLLRLTTLY